MSLDEIHRGVTKRRRRHRVGRGTGSGWGKTAGRGHKGQHSRAGSSKLAVFQGGAMPLVRRVPKRGFNNKFALLIKSINIGDLDPAFEVGEEVTPDTLRQKSLVKGPYDELKILGDGVLSKKLVVSAHRFSKSAKEKIEGAGGQVVVLPGKIPVKVKQKAARAS